MAQGAESLRWTEPHQQALYDYAEGIVTDEERYQRYLKAMWELSGDPSDDNRFHGRHPWLKRPDATGNIRTLSVPVFSGYSTQTDTLCVVRKDPWTDPSDPASWLFAELNLGTGNYVEPRVLSARVYERALGQRAHQLRLQLAPKRYSNWPPGMHPAKHALPADQIRVHAVLDPLYHTTAIEYRDGREPAIQYGDIEALHSMIRVVEEVRSAQEGGERVLHPETLHETESNLRLAS